MRRLLQTILGKDRSKPNAPQALAAGNAALGDGRLDDAAEAYRQALDADPASATARVNLAYVLLEQRQPGPAADLLKQAIGLLPAADALLPDAWFLLARACEQRDDGGGALEAYRHALAARPVFAEAVAALVALAYARYDAGDDAAAQQVLDTILQHQPTHEAALSGRGHVLLRQGDYAAAAEVFRRVLALHGENAQRLVDLASACHRLGMLDEAAALEEQALALEPRHPGALNLRVVSLTTRGKVAQAEVQAREALRMHPDDADLHWSLCIALLLQGKLRQAWPEHRWRSRASAMATSAPPPRSEPAWLGQPLEGRSIVLVSEQGLGDALQFVRYVPLVARDAGRVYVQAAPTLHRLLRGLPANCEVTSPTQAVRADFHCALMDLPEVFATGLEDIPAAVPYLRTDAARVAQWTEQLRRAGQRLVGIACSGNPRHTNDGNRSIPLERWAPVLGADCRFIGLQPEMRASDRAAAADLPLDLRPASEVRDFADTAALVEALDLVITVDTSLAHLAGALGRPVWILLPYAPDWRWMLDRSDSPWYPTARLYRQPAAGDWETVLRRVHADLAAWQPG